MIDRTDLGLGHAMRVLAGRALLQRTSLALSPIPVVALKGVVISALTEGSGDPPRHMSDVDILIPAGARADAERRIAALGMTKIASTSVATTFRDAELDIDLDLHVRLSEPGLFSQEEQSVLSRACPGIELFGFDVSIPDRHDLYAHLVAHFVRNRSNASDTRRVRDFLTVARYLPMRPPVLAERLSAVGLARAARLVLPLVAERGDEFAARVLKELPYDPAGARIARFARIWLQFAAGNDPIAAPIPHLLNHSLPAGAASFARHVANWYQRAKHERRG